MNLFAARLTHRMLSTDDFEKTIHEMQERVKRWRAIEQSPELAEYYALKKKVESTDFQERKKVLKYRKYKNTEEGRKMLSYQDMYNSRSMRRYREALVDPDIQEFLKFRESEDFAKIHSFKQFFKSALIRKYYFIYHSSFYKNYLRVLNSAELRQLAELEKEVTKADFKKRHDLWADPKRWEHSEEYKVEQRYLELANSDDIKFFFETRQDKIDWAELFRPAFEDDMSSSKNWKPGYGYANPAMKDGHSRTTQRQAYNGGHNTYFVDGRMNIETHEESKKAVAWDEKKGFVEHVFEYTSDVMNTKEAFAQEQGLFMAKVRSQGAGHHFFGLTTGQQKKPIVALYHYNGHVHQLGLIHGEDTWTVDLRGMMRTMYYVYSFRWTKNELIWYINDLEVLRLPNRLPKEALFFLAQSWLPMKEKGGEGKLKVQWVRVYKGV